MKQYINKSALIAEIEKRQEEEVCYDEDGSFASLEDQNHYSTLESIKNFINTIETKEVKLDRESAWKPAGGDDLPEIDREVIALVWEFGLYKVVFAHRVDENAEVHTSVDGKPLVLHPMKYDEGGWNLPDVKFWLDLDLPKMEE